MTSPHRKIFSAQRHPSVKLASIAPLALARRTENGGTADDGPSLDNLISRVEALLDDVRDLGQGAGPASRQHADGSDSGLRDVRIEIARMVREIGQAKREIAAIKHPMASEDQVHTASQHLEEIVGMTESATNDIIAGVDAVDDVLKQIRADASASEDVHELVDTASLHLVKIIEACGFQDLTGQRIAQVVKVLRRIEQRVIAMIDIWGLDAFRDLPVLGDEIEEAERLLNGPALGGQGLSQEDVDALFD